MGGGGGGGSGGPTNPPTNGVVTPPLSEMDHPQMAPSAIVSDSGYESNLGSNSGSVVGGGVGSGIGNGSSEVGAAAFLSVPASEASSGIGKNQVIEGTTDDSDRGEDKGEGDKALQLSGYGTNGVTTSPQPADVATTRQRMKMQESQ